VGQLDSGTVGQRDCEARVRLGRGTLKQWDSKALEEIGGGLLGSLTVRKCYS
jgi:hypothetical protein